jgi:uncharacterized protein
VDSLAWRRNFLQTFLERDLPQMGVQIPALALRRFWNMVAHYHGQTWNGAELARALSVNESTVRRYMDLMTGVFMVRQLPPWFENLGERQVKAPKILRTRQRSPPRALGCDQRARSRTSPQGRCLVERLRHRRSVEGTSPDDAYYWATYNDAEIDLLLFKDSKRIGVECKRMDAPKLTPSMRIALMDLKLDRLLVVYPGEQRYALGDRVDVVPLAQLVARTSKP